MTVTLIDCTTFKNYDLEEFFPIQHRKYSNRAKSSPRSTFFLSHSLRILFFAMSEHKNWIFLLNTFFLREGLTFRSSFAMGLI